MTAMSNRRVVITGLGVVAPNGIGKDAFWENTIAQRCAIRPISRFDATPYAAHMAGEVRDFEASNFLPVKVIKQTDRCTHMAIAACQMACRDAVLDLNRNQEEIGMYFANQFGGMEFAESELYAQLFIGPDRVSAYQAIAWFYAASQGQWSILTGIRGHGKSIVADRLGGLQALAWAALAIQRRHCSVAFAGGFEAPLVPYTFLIHQSSGLLSDEAAEPARSYCPFDVARKGLVLAEGSGIVIVEDLEHAVARGARVYAEIVGYAMNCSRLRSDGTSDNRDFQSCLASAIKRANVTPDQIDHVLPEGLATSEGDKSEAEAIASVLQHGPTVSVPKSLTGHAMSAAGALDAIWACLMMHYGRLLPTANLTNPDPCLPLNYVMNSRSRIIDTVLCCGRGQGGLNGALVLRRCN